MAVLTTSGRTAIAESIAARPLHLAWGTGDPAWDTTPIPETIETTALTAELGRLAATVVDYAIPDEGGSINVPTGTYSISPTPTNYLYLKFDFDYDHEPNAEIREAGLFMDTILVGGLPGGQVYFPPGDVSDPGSLVALEYFTKIVRSALIRQSFEFVLAI